MNYTRSNYHTGYTILICLITFFDLLLLTLLKCKHKLIKHFNKLPSFYKGCSVGLFYLISVFFLFVLNGKWYFFS